MITRIIKTWEFTNSERELTELFGVRLNAEDQSHSRLQLIADPQYSIETTNYAKTRKDTPHSVLSWSMFEAIWGTTEPDFTEYSLLLTGKSGNNFEFYARSAIPRIGDHVYQGDSRTKISDISGSTLTLEDAAGITDGISYANRTRCDVLIQILDKDDVAYFYNTATSAWEEAGPTDWSTMYVVNNHIGEIKLKDFGKTIGFNVNLRTTDPIYTPQVFSIYLLGTFDIEFTEDILFDSLIPTLEASLSVTTQINIKLVEDTDVVDFANQYVLDCVGYNITDVEIAYNVTQDPTKTENIATTYTLGEPKERNGNLPGSLKLNSVQSAGDILEIKLKYYPEIAINTAKEYYEITKHPLIVLEHITKKGSVTSPNSDIGRSYIRNKLTLTGVKENSPEQYDLIIEYVVFTGNQTDQYRLGEALHRFFNSTTEIRSWGLDEPYPLIVGTIFRSENTPGIADISTHVGQFRIANLVEVIRDPLDVALVEYLNRSMTTD
jgi:hypothetical protein